MPDRLSGAAGDGAPPLEEGWYLMSTEGLERELARWRGDRSQPPGDVVKITTRWRRRPRKAVEKVEQIEKGEKVELLPLASEPVEAK